MLINLHSHLEGRVRPETATELARQLGIPDPDDRSPRGRLTEKGPTADGTYEENIPVCYFRLTADLSF